jgi:hypothetical protein
MRRSSRARSKREGRGVLAVPEVVGAVLVGHDDDGQLGVAFDGIHAVRGVSVMFLDVGREALKRRFPATTSAQGPSGSMGHIVMSGRLNIR